MSGEGESLQQRLHRAEVALRELQAENDASFELAGAGRIDIIVETGEIVRVNKTLCTLLGYAAHELRGRKVEDISHPEDLDVFTEARPWIISGEVPLYVTTKRYIRKDGGIIWVTAHASLLPEKPGMPRMVTGVIQDITAQKAAEAAFNSTAMQFRAIFDNSIDAIAVYEGYEHGLVNPAYLKLFRYNSKEELNGVTGPDLIAPSAREMVRDRIARRLRGEDVPSAYVTRGIRKDGTEFDLEINASNFNLDGRVLRLVIVRDVTERVNAQQALRKAHEELELRVSERTADLQRANRYLLAMKQCTEALVKAASEPELLHSICGIIANTGAIRFAWVGICTSEQDTTLTPAAMHGVDMGDPGRTVLDWVAAPGGRDLIAKAVETRTAQVCHDTQSHPAFAGCKAEALAAGFLSMVCLPLVWENHPLGAICIYAGVENAFGSEELGMLEQFVSDLTFGIVALRTRADRERLQKELLDSSENERCRIGKDLHDGICQQLCGIQLFADLIARSLPSRGRSAKICEQLNRLKEIVHRTLIETRLLSRGLSPVAVESEGLVAALLDLTVNAEQLSGVACKFQCPDASVQFDTILAMHLYRIAQEAIGNALKHSHARRITVKLLVDRQETVLEIADNGTGFPSVLVSKCGMGLRTMAYRADVIGGKLEIEPGLRAGTRVRCRFKLPAYSGRPDRAVPIFLERTPQHVS